MQTDAGDKIPLEKNSGNPPSKELTQARVKNMQNAVFLPQMREANRQIILFLLFYPTFTYLLQTLRSLTMRQNVKLLRTLLLGSLLVGLYMILVIAFHLHGGPPSKLWNENGVTLNTIEGDGRIPFSNFQFGGVNQHAWYGHCITSFEQLCSYPIFPKGPDARDFAKNVNITSLANEVDGLRLLGFLRPIVTGEYIFVLMSNGFAEVWLSSNRNWKNARKIAYATPSKATSDKLGFGELTT